MNPLSGAREGDLHDKHSKGSRPRTLSMAGADATCPIAIHVVPMWYHVPAFSQWKAQGFRCEAVLYSVFLVSFTETTSIFRLNERLRRMTKDIDTYFIHDSIVAFSNASLQDTVLGQESLECNLAADQYSELLIRVSSFLDLNHLIYNVFIYVYIHKLSYIQRNGELLNLHWACPRTKVKYPSGSLKVRP